jgi:hypothetical protein
MELSKWRPHHGFVLFGLVTYRLAERHPRATRTPITGAAAAGAPIDYARIYRGVNYLAMSSVATRPASRGALFHRRDRSALSSLKHEIFARFNEKRPGSSTSKISY